MSAEVQGVARSSLDEVSLFLVSGDIYKYVNCFRRLLKHARLAPCLVRNWCVIPGVYSHCSAENLLRNCLHGPRRD